MFGQTTRGTGNLSDSANRMYRIEVEGMGQNIDADKVSYRVRSTGRTFISVPYARMSEQMQRINRMGGKIISIEPLGSEGSSEAKMEATAAHQSLKASGKPKTVGAEEGTPEAGGDQEAQP